MSVAVRMEMPKDGVCDGCGARTVEFLAGPICTISKKFLGSSRPSWCPIICQLPEGHGRLGDLDALVNQWATVPDKLSAGAGENKWVADMVMGIQGHFLEGIIKSLEEAPTIVPAEAERSEM